MNPENHALIEMTAEARLWESIAKEEGQRVEELRARAEDAEAERDAMIVDGETEWALARDRDGWRERAEYAEEQLAVARNAHMLAEQKIREQREAGEWYSLPASEWDLVVTEHAETEHARQVAVEGYLKMQAALARVRALLDTFGYVRPAEPFYSQDEIRAALDGETNQ